MRRIPALPWPALVLALALPLNSRALPLITKVVETGGDNEATDTVTAKFTGETFSNGIAGEFQNPYTVGKFVEDVPAMVDRAHQWNGGTDAGLPSYLVGGQLHHERQRQPRQRRLPARHHGVRTGDGLPPGGQSPHRRHRRRPARRRRRSRFLDADDLAGGGRLAPMLNGLNRTGDPSIPDEVGVDEAGDGVGPGVSIQNWSSVYARSVPAGTSPSASSTGAGSTCTAWSSPGRRVHPTTRPRSPTSKPANNALFHPASSGLSFTAKTVSPNSIAAANLKLQLNGTDVSANLTVTGETTRRPRRDLRRA